MWKLVPPKPNAETPALLGFFNGLGQSLGAVGTKNGISDHSTVGFGVLKPADGGIVLWCKANTPLIIPAIPAAAFRCPICDLIEPTATWSPPSYPLHRRESVDNSVASPTLVEVPWASTNSTVEAS